jgi:hypothetical protein
MLTDYRSAAAAAAIMQFDPRDPDASLVVVFKHVAVPNEAKSKAEGRLVCDDIEICEIRTAGSKEVKHFPATEFSDWVVDPFTGGQARRTYAERFSRQYQQFKERAAQTISGTPLDLVQFLTAGRKAELRALNLYTVEQLAHIDGQELKNLGPGGRDLKNQAIDFIESRRSLVADVKVREENEALRARNQALETDIELLRHKRRAEEAEFIEMTDAELLAYIAERSGVRPTGSNIPHKTLVRMAMDARPTNSEAA